MEIMQQYGANYYFFFFFFKSCVVFEINLLMVNYEYESMNRESSSLTPSLFKGNENENGDDYRSKTEKKKIPPPPTPITIANDSGFNKYSECIFIYL